jgi:hypothetical protein
MAIEIWSWAFVLPLTGALTAAALLIYARLVGRLAWLLDLRDEDEDTSASDPLPTKPAGDLAASHDALESPPAQEEVVTRTPETYGVIDEPAPPRTPRSVDPVRLSVAAPVVTEDRPRLPARRVVETKSPAPRRLLVPGIYRFPWYRGSIQSWLLLTLGGTLLALVFRLAMLLH